MPPSSGSRLGPYEILSPLGAGGMGEVYRARDTRLDRTVAIKVLPQQTSNSPEARSRFEREARAVSALNHPHICTLHDIGTQDGVDYLVMEHLDGETLADRLAKGPLALDHVLRVGAEVAEALAAAHRQGVVHRDLKPGNIMLTKTGAKLLDFGLAKLRAAPATPASGLTALATEQKPLTAEGTIMGTFQYMAPEQLEGKDADTRTDIFALGSILYEMVTGRRPFSGKSQASLIASILAAEPPGMAELAPMTPASLHRLVKACLAKDPDERIQSAHDVAQHLRWIAEGGPTAQQPGTTTAPRQGRERLAWAVVALLALTSITLALIGARTGRTPTGEKAVKFHVAPPDKTMWKSFNSLSISPDGRRIVFYADGDDGIGRLWVRNLDSLTAQPLQGTEFGNASFPFWSPDSRWVGFSAAGKLKKVEIAGGAPRALCDAPDGRGGTWSKDGVILFSPKAGSPVLSVPESGGEPVPVTKLPDASQRDSHMWPRFLPDGKHFLYFVRGSRKEDQWLEIGTLGSGETRRLIEAESGAFYAPPGYLLFVRGGSLLAQPFDAAKLSFTADPIPVAEEIGMNAGSSYHAFAVSEAGMLVYRVGGLAARSLTWFDRAGRQVAVLGKPGEITNPEISPDGKKVVFEREPSQGSTAELWAMDLARETQARLTFGSTDEFEPIWSPDGSRIFFASFRDESVSIFVKDASGAAGEEALLTTHTMKDLMDVSRDGRFLAFCEESPETQLDLMVMPLTGDRTPRPFAKTRFVECQARFSPDSKWLAYASDETGRSEVHVQSFPGPGGKWQISTNGGGQPQWSRDGKEIFYMGFNGSIMVTPIETRGDAIEPGTPVRITDTGLGFSTVRNHYSVSPDGQRILVSLRAGNTVSPPMTVVLNWTADLKR